MMLNGFLFEDCSKNTEVSPVTKEIFVESETEKTLSVFSYTINTSSLGAVTIGFSG